MLGLALGLLLAGPALAAELDSQLQDLLAKHDSAPTQAEFQALGEGVDAELLRLAQDPETRSSARARAILALGWYPSPQAQVFLTSTLAEGSGVDRRKAAQALATGWGYSPALEQALADQDVQLRMATIRALAQLDSPQAHQALQARVMTETDEDVQALLAESLTEGAP